MVIYLSERQIRYIVRKIRGEKQVKSCMIKYNYMKSSLNDIDLLIIIACVINGLALYCYYFRCIAQIKHKC